MKLPESRRDQIGLLVFAVIGAVAVIVAVVFGVAKPFLGKRKEVKDQIASLENDLRIARQKVDQMSADHAEDTNVIARLHELDQYVLHPRLGNYLLSASEALETYAHEVNVSLESVGEGPIVVIPTPAGMKATRTLKAYTARVKLLVGLHDLVRFLRVVETRNPYACVSALDIAADPKRPQTHEVSFDIQWPIWDESDNTPDVVRELLSPGAGNSTSTVAPRQTDAPEPSETTAPPAASAPSATLEPPPLPPAKQALQPTSGLYRLEEMVDEALHPDPLPGFGPVVEPDPGR